MKGRDSKNRIVKSVYTYIKGKVMQFSIQIFGMCKSFISGINRRDSSDGIGRIGMSGHFVRIDEGAINQTRVEDSSSSFCQYVSTKKVLRYIETIITLSLAFYVFGIRIRNFRRPTQSGRRKWDSDEKPYLFAVYLLIGEN